MVRPGHALPNDQPSREPSDPMTASGGQHDNSEDREHDQPQSVVIAARRGPPGKYQRWEYQECGSGQRRSSLESSKRQRAHKQSWKIGTAVGVGIVSRRKGDEGGPYQRTDHNGQSRRVPVPTAHGKP